MSTLHSRTSSRRHKPHHLIIDEESSAVSSLSSRSAWRRPRERSGGGISIADKDVDGSSRWKGHESKATLLLLLAILIVLQYHGGDSEKVVERRELAHQSYYASFTRDNSLSSLRDGGRPIVPSDSQNDEVNEIERTVQEAEAPSSHQERMDDLQFHRMLQQSFVVDADAVSIPTDMMDDESSASDASSNTADQQSISTTIQYQHLAKLPPYNLPSALQQISTYRTAFALFIYDPQSNEFYTLYSRRHIWSSAVGKLLRAVHSLSYLLRLEFGQDLDGRRRRGEELVIPISSGDYPLVKDTECVRRSLGERVDSCVEEGGAPVLHFGSVFARPMYPNMIAMPPPESHHLNCYEEWATHTSICSALRAKSLTDPKGELIYAKEFGIKWKDLKEQVVWRGTDFGYLSYVHPTMKRPSQSDSKVRRDKSGSSSSRNKSIKSSTLMSQQQEALSALRQDYDNLVPRWKGVVHTAEAQLSLQREIQESARGQKDAASLQDQMLPWANIKFSQFIGDQGVKAPTIGSKEYREWESIGFPAVGEAMSLEELAGYKYHIDLGGGGGTTWSGTLHKLAFPGLLFHHVTPTQDYIHTYMKPWRHYVPVSPDLSDLKAKFDWAQSHPKKAFQIARNGSELMRYLTSPKGMEERYQKDILGPLRAVIDAYIPLSQMSEYKDKSWKEALTELEGEGNVLPILKCTGESSKSCETIVGKEAFLDRNVLRRVTNAGEFEAKKTDSPQVNNRQLAPWAHQFFADVNKKPDTSRETAMFWHIPKSGGTTIKNLYHCTGQTLAHRGGVDPKFGHDRKDELVAFQPKENKGKFVNVDTTIKEGILRAKEMGLVQSHVSDIIFTMEPTFAGQNLYDKKNKGRILALFRHPIERMVSKFYYLQIADWERGYRPDWKDLSLMEWIEKAELKDDNLVVRKLVGKSYSESIDETDLMHAKAILRRRVVVGLMNQMEESVHRFNIVLGIDESLEGNRQCMDEYFGKPKEKVSSGMKNSNKHPKVPESSPEWQLLAEKEWLDMRLYAYAEQLFDEQKATIYSYK